METILRVWGGASWIFMQYQKVPGKEEKKEIFLITQLIHTSYLQKFVLQSIFAHLLCFVLGIMYQLPKMNWPPFTLSSQLDKFSVCACSFN